MIKVRDGYGKLIGSNYNGDITLILLSDGGNLAYAVSSTENTLVLRNASGQIESSVASTISPFIVSSTKVNTNLNADLLDGFHATGLFQSLTSATDKNLYVKIGNTEKNIALYASYLGGVSKEGLFTELVNVNDSTNPNSIKITIGGTTKYLKVGYADVATKVGKKLILKIKSGNSEDSTMYTYDGSADKTLDIKLGTGITLSTAANALTITNAGVRSIATGDDNGTIKVNTNGTSTNVAVKGLGSAAYTASTNYAVRKTLTNEDLNSVVTPGFYNSGGGNTVTNKPSGVDHFGMLVIHGASGSYYVQILFEESYSNVVWRRHCTNGTWSSWVKDECYNIVSSANNGLAPLIGTAAAATINSLANDWVLTSTSGGTPTWRKLPSNAFNNTNYYRPISVNGTAILGNNNTALNLVAGSNVTITPEKSGDNYTGKVTIASSDTKVTSVSNHYTPSNGSVTATTAGSAIGWSGAVVTGIARDAAGHITGVTTGTIPANPNSNTIPSAYCTTAAATAAKVASCTNYILKANSYVHVLIRYANTVAGAITLNINSTGAKPIYINGAASSSSNYTLPAGTYIAFYNGTNFYFRTDDVLPGTVEKISNNLTLKIKSGTAEGTDLYTYNGSAAKTLDIKQGSNITLTAAAGALTIAATNTKNTAGSTNSTSKLFLIGATSQAANPQTYSNSAIYATSGVLNAASFQGNLDGTYVNKLTGYTKATEISSITATDSLNTALGKLEFKTDFIYNDLFGTDSDEYINKWSEIVGFLDSVKEGTDILDEFVTRKTNQNITGEKIFKGTTASLLTVDRNSTNPAWVRFMKNGTLLGYLGVNNNKEALFNNGTTAYTIVHAGNYTSYLPILNSSSTHATNASVIYAPTTAGTSGQVLTSNGSGAPGWANSVATANNGIFYIEGTGSTAGTWLGSHTGITSYYTGLTIAYKIPIAGASTTTLNINSLGAKTCYINTSKLTTHYGVGATAILVYDGTYFRAADYWDGNNYAYVRQYVTDSTNAEYPLLFRYNTAAPSNSSYATEYTRYDSGITINPSTNTITVPTLKFSSLNIPTSSGGTTFGPGTSGQVLKSNGTTVYWASDSNSDTKVTQTITTTDASYRILFSNTADDTTRTEAARKSTKLTFNPSTGNIVATSFTGKLIVSGGSYSWYNIQQYNASDATPSYYKSDCAIININSYSGWLPWIKAVDSEKGSWTIGQYTTNLHIGYIPKSNTSNNLTYNWTFSKDGSTILPGSTTIAGTLTLTKTVDAAHNSDNYPALIVGGTHSTAHLELDNNEIIAKTNGTSIATLYLNAGGEANSVRITEKTVGGTTTPVYLNSGVITACTSYTSALDSRYVNVTGDTMTGILTMSNTRIRMYGTTATPAWDSPGAITWTESASDGQPVSLVYTSYDSYRAPAGLKLMGSQGGEWLEVVGNIYGNGFVKSGSSNSYVLLGGGNHKALSDFVLTSSRGYIGTTAVQASSASLALTGITYITQTGSRTYAADGIYGISLGNSDIIGANGIWFADASDSSGEGLHFYRDGSKWDTLTAAGGILYFSPNRALATHTLTPVFSALSNSGNNISITIGGLNRTLTPAYATNADTVDGYHASSFLHRLRRFNLNISSTYSGMVPPDLLGLKNGYPIYTDPEFALGNNSILVYNNSGGSAVTITREASTTSGNSSGYCLHIKSAASGASPNGGGWYFATLGTLARVSVCIFRANIPSGYNVVFHTNTVGSGSNHGWLTDNSGTGKYEWYAYMVEWGSSPSSSFFFTLDKAATVDWYLCYANVIDISRASYDGLRTRYADSATTVTINLHISNDTDYPIVWSNSNNTTNAVTTDLFKSYAHLTYNPKTQYVKAGSFLCDNWFRSTGNTGWHNPTNNCHIYPNTIGSYGGMIIRGEKGSYHGALLGTSKNYMCLMSNDVHHGLYCETNGLWEFYYSRSSKSAGILTSALTASHSLTVPGGVKVGFITTDSNLYGDSGGIRLNNSDIHGLNAIYTADLASDASEGIQFKRTNGNYDSIWASDGTLYFSPNGPTYNNNYTVLHTGNMPTGKYSMRSWWVDASGLDLNTWYPVTISVSPYGHSRVLIEVSVNLDSGTKPSWSTHASGFTVNKIWETNGSGWGTATVHRTIYVSGYGFASSDPVRGIGLLTNGSIEYFYVRGGGKYLVYTSNGSAPTLRTSTYTNNSLSVGPTTTAPGGIGAFSTSFNITAPNFYSSSDIALKTNIQAITSSDNIPQLKAFDWKEDGSHSYGLIAQELEELGYSELVELNDDYKTVNYSAALSLIVGKLQVKIKELENEIENLKNKN